jgi:hypothetical protein
MLSIRGAAAATAVHIPASAAALPCLFKPLLADTCWCCFLFCLRCQDFNRTLLFDIKLLSVRKAPR